MTDLIKIISIERVGEYRLLLGFSDGTSGIWNAYPLFSTRPTDLTTPLLQREAFEKAFIEAGALAWPNGLELAPWTLHAELAEAGSLRKNAA